MCEVWCRIGDASCCMGHAVYNLYCVANVISCDISKVQETGAYVPVVCNFQLIHLKYFLRIRVAQVMQCLRTFRGSSRTSPSPPLPLSTA